MIVFQRVRWKNFLSTGNDFTEIDLQKSRLTLLIGSNGSGKSTMLDAICYALFGKAYRNINKPQLINSINEKDCVVEIEFSVNGVPCKVRRGMRPGLFEIYQNGALINQTAAARDYQKYLEQQILKLNFKSFTQVAILGSAAFTPFMQLPVGQRREVIEDLLDISVFSRMKWLLKEKGRGLKEDYKTLTSQVDNYDKNIIAFSNILKKIQETNEKEAADFDEQIGTLRDILTHYNNMLSEKSKHIQKLNQEIPHAKALIQGIIDETRALDAKLNAEIKSKMTTKNLLESTTSCPLCLQEMDLDARDTTLSVINEDLARAHANHKSVEKNRAEIALGEKRLDHLRTMLGDLIDECTKITQDITKTQAKIKALETEKSKVGVADNSEDVEKELQKAQTELAAAKDAKAELDKIFTYHTVMDQLLQDTGMKTKIIKRYIPIINKWINNYLQVLDFFVHFSLDETFNESILSRHRDHFTYSSFSEGEKQKINLAVMFAWRQIAKIKNSLSTNLLILDETFDSSLDADGVDNLMRIFDTIDEKTNVFVISHRGVNESAFDRVLKATKSNNFSKIE